MILSGLGGYRKRSPKAHKLEDITTTDHHRVVLASFPKPYPKTSQQKKVSAVARECGLKKGMNRRDLVHKMIDCVGPKMAK